MIYLSISMITLVVMVAALAVKVRRLYCLFQELERDSYALRLLEDRERIRERGNHEDYLQS